MHLGCDLRVTFVEPDGHASTSTELNEETDVGHLGRVDHVAESRPEFDHALVVRREPPGHLSLTADGRCQAALVGLPISHGIKEKPTAGAIADRLSTPGSIERASQ